jgi:hypothetical protein
MKKILIPLTILIGIWLIACGGTSENSESNVKAGNEVKVSKEKDTGFIVNIDGQDNKFEPTSTWATHWEKTFSYPVDGETVKETSAHSTVILANYELDSKDGKFSLNKQKIEKPEQIKISFSFTGEKGTDYSTPIKVGEYEIEPGDFLKGGESFNKVDGVEIHYFSDGKEKEASFNGNKMKGKINITEVTDNTISGNIDVTDGKHSVKGSFSAKGDESVK